MRSSLSSATLVLSVALALALLGCNDDPEHYLPLVPPAEQPVKVPNVVSGSFCTEDPSSLTFPVKVWMAIDDTGSMVGANGMAGNDPNQKRFTETKALAGRLMDPGHVYFGGLVFSRDHMEVFSKPRFMDQLADFNSAVDAVMGKAAGGTPYIDTLLRTISEIRQDIQEFPEKAKKTTYIVIFLSDGQPDPPEDLVQILGRVEELMSLRGLAGKVVLHTVFLGNPNPGTEDRLRQMSAKGEGIHKSFPSGDALEFGGIDFGGIRRNYIQRNFFLVNRSLVPSKEGQVVDSDGDGLADEDELKNWHTDPAKQDTDGDGCSDLFETRKGWDPLRNVASQCFCDAKLLVDTDKDGFNDCQEQWIGANIKEPDSDMNVDAKVVGDYVPDELDYIYFNDVTKPNDTNSDRDRDGVTDMAEFEVHTSVFAQDTDRSAWAYRYSDFSPVPGNQRCRTFQIDNVVLAPTLATADHAAGENLLELWYFQSAEDNPFQDKLFRRARKLVPYSPGGLQLKIVPEDFSEKIAPVP